MAQIRAIKVNHLNTVLEDFEGSLDHFVQAYGGEYFLEVQTPDARAGLFEVGNVIFEVFSPKMWLLNARYGPHYLGLEFQVESLAEGRLALDEHGIRVARELGIALHSNPADLHGTSIELYEDEFHERDYELLGGRKLRGQAFWRDEHPLGLTGIAAVTWPVHDAALVAGKLGTLFGATQAYAEDRPALGARAIGVPVADTVMELLQPTGPGVIADHLRDHGEGLRSTVLGARDMAAVRSWCADHALPLEAGSAANRLAVPAAANHGVMIEFASV